MLNVEKIGKNFGGIVALNNFYLALEKGQILGLIGPNGAGKTTALNILSGIIVPSEGEISFKSQPINAFTAEKRARLGINRTFQNIRLFDELTVLQNVKVGAHSKYSASLLSSVLGLPSQRASEKKITEIAESALEQTGMLDFRELRADQLSYGDKRRVEIARALACEPELLMLDEPAAGMNEKEKATLSDLIVRLNQEHGLSVILIEHNIPMVVELCEKLVVISKGETIVDGPTKDVIRDERVIEVYFGKRHQNRVSAT